MKKSWIGAAAAALLMAGSAQAALVELFDATVGGAALDSVADAQAVIAAASGPSLSIFDTTVNYSGTSFPGNFGSPNDIFVMRVTGTLDTSMYSSLSMVHDDGFRVSLNSLTFFQFNANTSPTTTNSGALANTGVATFSLIYWDQGGANVAQLYGINRTTGARELVVLGNPAAVPVPGTLALAGLGLLGLAVASSRSSRQSKA
jgi:PEP-CTERM motif